MFFVGPSIIVKDNKFVSISKNGGRFGYFSPPDAPPDMLRMGGLEV